jgi:hypothetical protein
MANVLVQTLPSRKGAFVIGKIVSAMVGKKIAERTPGLSEGGGALIGLAAATVMRRMGPLGFVAAAGGGWLATRYLAKRQERQAQAY